MSEWQKVPVANICKIFLGGTPKRSEPSYWGGPIKWASAKDVANCSNRYLKATEETITQKGVKESAAKVLEKDTIVITARGTVGALCMLGEPMSFNQTCYGLIAGQEINPHYLYYSLKEAISQIRSLSYGTVFDTITMKSFKNLMVPLPSLEEQRAIAHILGSLDDKIELNRRMNETLEAMAQAIFKSWFVDFDPVRAKAKGRDTGWPEEIAALFPDSFEDSAAKKFPKGWKIGTIGDIGKQTRDIVKPEELGANNNYISLEHMPKRSISLWNWGSSTGITSSKFFFKRGDILFGKLRPYFHKVGVPAIEGVCSTDIVVVVPKQEFYFGLLLGHISSDDFVAYANAASTGTKMPRTNWKDMSRYPISIPDSRVLIVYNEYIQNIVKMLHANIHESKILANVRDALLPRLISGELRVPDAEKFIEEARV